VPAALARQIADREPTVTIVAAAPDFQIVHANGAAHRVARRAAGDLIGARVTEAFGFVDPEPSYGSGICAASQPPPMASISATLACRRLDSTLSAVCSALRRVVCAVITLL